jgi:hypothetical protein
MRIQAPNGSAAPATASAPAPRRGSPATFTLTESSTATAAGAPASLRTVGGIDALIALQGVGDPTERRRLAVKRGRLVLDALDELKIGLLGGALSSALLNRLKSAAAHLKEESGDRMLDAVLGEIELRAEVEIAKLAAR